MSGLELYTLVHVLISLIGIGAGLIVAFGLLAAKPLNGLTAIFLYSTLLTDITGFLFPYHGFKPSYGVGIIDTVLVLVAMYAKYGQHLAGGWSRTYAVTAVLALYFNVFVLIVQSFQKVPALHALAPTATEPPFKITQLVVLTLFLVLTVASGIRFRSAALRPA
jgi:hypothetical protein